MSTHRSLNRRFPGLQLSFCPLGTFPSPIQRLDPLWVFDEGLSGFAYGGNKIRKLEPLLAEVLRRGQTDVIVLGAAGSHQAVATAVCAEPLGLRVHAVLAPQPRQPHAAAQLQQAAARCASITPISKGEEPALVVAGVVERVYARTGRAPARLPLGGSNALGTVGWVDAGLELGEAIAAEQLPRPARVVVAVATGGTAAGLWLGLRLAGVRVEVVGVRVVAPPLGSRRAMRSLVRRTARLLRRAGAEIDLRPDLLDLNGLTVRGDWLAGGYGCWDDQTASAMALGRALGLQVEPTYTAKALGAAWSLAQDGRPTVYVHTLNARPLSVPTAPPPARLADLLTGGG